MREQYPRTCLPTGEIVFADPIAQLVYKAGRELAVEQAKGRELLPRINRTGKPVNVNL